MERRSHTAQDIFVVAFGGAVAPEEFSVIAKGWLLHIRGKGLTENSRGIFVEEASPNQLTNDEAHPAGRMKMIHIGGAIRVDTGEERRDFGKMGEIIPVEVQTRRRRHGDEMQRVMVE